MKVENTFVLPAPPEQAFRTLIDLASVVPCMPGVELTELLEGHRFRATAKVCIGSIELRFAGEGNLSERDEARRTATVRVWGGAANGRGSFRTEMHFTVAPSGKAESQVRVDSSLVLAGSLVQIARGTRIVDEQAQQLCGEFATNVAALIEAQRIVRALAARAAATAVAAPRAVATVGAGASASPARPAIERAPQRALQAADDRREIIAPVSTSAPLSALRVFWNAVRATLRRWFGARP